MRSHNVLPSLSLFEFSCYLLRNPNWTFSIIILQWAGKTIALGTFPAAEADEKCKFVGSFDKELSIFFLIPPIVGCYRRSSKSFDKSLEVHNAPQALKRLGDA